MEQKNKKAKTDKKIMDMAHTLDNEKYNGPVSDILGSYTGTPVDGEVPEQDQDDL